MLKKKLFPTLLLFISLSLDAQSLKPRVIVLPIQSSDNYQLEIVSDRVTSTSELVLKMLGKYEMIKTPDMIPSDIADYCAANSIDNVITGKTCYTDNGNTITVSMSVYTREEGKITLETHENAQSIFDVFDAAEKAVFRLLEGFSGEHIGFGTIIFNNNGFEGDYWILIDGNNYQLTEGKTEKVLNGNREVEVYQERMFGSYTVDKRSVDIVEGKETSFNVTIPGFLDSEKAEIEKRERIIRKYWEKRKKAEKIEKAFNELNVLLENTAYSSTANEKKVELSALQKEWDSQKLLLAKKDGKREIIAGIKFGSSKENLIENLSETDEGIILSSKTESTFDETPGLFLDWQLTERFFLRMEINILTFQFDLFANDVSGEGGIQIYEIPLMVKYSLSPNTKGMGLFLGPTLDILSISDDWFSEGRSNINGTDINVINNNNVFGAKGGVEFVIPIFRTFLYFDLFLSATSAMIDFQTYSNTIGRFTSDELFFTTAGFSVRYGFNFGGDGYQKKQ